MKMKTPLSPSDIDILIWCYCRCEPHPQANAPAVLEGVGMFQDCGMIKSEMGEWGFYDTTDKGKAMVEALRQTAEPRQVWVTE